MRSLKTLLVPALFGLALLTIALVTRSGWFARENPGEPINSAMREAMHMMTLPTQDEAVVNRLFPQHEITGTGLRYIVDHPGDGQTHPQRGDEVALRYRATFLDGTPLDATDPEGPPYEVVIGRANVIPGLDEAVLDMTLGEQRTLIVPFWLAYGEKGIQGHVPPRATLIFEVELVAIP